MTQTASLPTPQHTAGGYRHEALLWHGTDDFVAQTVPFLQDAVAQGIPVMVAVPGAHWEPVRAELGAAADEVDYVDMTVLGHNPARIIPAWSDFIARNGGGTRPVRGIGEPIWAGRRPQELVECQIHEALLNLAVPAETPLWLLCPYDTENLDDDVLAEASRSHPTLVHDGGLVASGTYGGPEHPLALATRPLAPPPAHRDELAFGDGELGDVRRVVRRHAAEAGLTGRRAGDLVVGVIEIAAIRI
ncbi:MAG: hypothetical protein JWP95_813 [Actinotalea sp.]|nr:hypothetical protein [Actinotalea sp.]